MYFSMEILCSCYRNCNQIFRLELTSHHQWYDWEKGRKGGRRERGKKRKKTIRPERDISLKRHPSKVKFAAPDVYARPNLKPKRKLTSLLMSSKTTVTTGLNWSNLLQHTSLRKRHATSRNNLVDNNNNLYCKMTLKTYSRSSPSTPILLRIFAFAPTQLSASSLAYPMPSNAPSLKQDVTCITKAETSYKTSYAGKTRPNLLLVNAKAFTNSIAPAAQTPSTSEKHDDPLTSEPPNTKEQWTQENGATQASPNTDKNVTPPSIGHRKSSLASTPKA